MAYAPDYWRVRHLHGTVVGWPVSRRCSPVRCPRCMCGCESPASIAFATVATTIGGSFDTSVPGVRWVTAVELAPHPAGHRQRRLIVMRKDNAIASGDASGTPQQQTQAEPAESPLERYLAVISDADEPEPPAQHSARVGPKVVSEVMTSGVVAAHEQAGFKLIVASLVRNRISAVPVINDDRKVIGVVSESDLLARVVAEPDHTSAIGHLRHGRRERLEKMHGETASSLMTTPAVTTHPDRTIADAARLAAKARVRRLPVVDTDGVLVGIVTRADLLRVFLEDDAEIRAQILDDIIVRQMALGPSDVEVFVNEGIVTLRGQLADKQMVQQLLESVHAVPAVVAVKSRLTCPVDDAPRRPVSLR